MLVVAGLGGSQRPGGTVDFFFFSAQPCGATDPSTLELLPHVLDKEAKGAAY